MCKNPNSTENYLCFVIKYIFSSIVYNDESDYQFSSSKILNNHTVENSTIVY